MHIIIICKIILMTMAGDVHTDLCRQLSHGTGNIYIQIIN